MPKRFCGMFKVCMLFAVFAFAAAIPAAAAEAAPDQDEVVMRRILANNTTMAVVKTLQLEGDKQITPSQLIKIRGIVYETSPKIIALAKRGGVFHEYKAALFDPDLCRENAAVLNAGTKSERMAIEKKKLAVTCKKYPKLWGWVISDKELHAILKQMEQEIDAITK